MCLYMRVCVCARIGCSQLFGYCAVFVFFLRRVRRERQHRRGRGRAPTPPQADLVRGRPRSIAPRVHGVRPQMTMQWFRMFENFNQVWGQIIAKHPIKHILVSLLAVLLLSLGLARLDLENDIRASFSPDNSRAAYENRVYKAFFNLTMSPQRAFILFSAKDNASMLRERELRDVLKLDRYFTNLLNRTAPETGIQGCYPLCNLNKPFHIITDELVKMYEHANKTPSDDLLLDYPMSQYRGQHLFIGMNMIGARISEQVFPSNNSRIVAVKTIILWYFSRADTKSTKELLRETTLNLFEEAKKGDYLQHVKFEIFGDEIANREMVRGAIEATTLMFIGFLLLVVFVCISIFPRLRRLHPCAVPVVVFVSVICPFLASVAAFGVLSWLGNKTYTIMCVTPFLVLGVGVDDAFILIESWKKHKWIGNKADRLSAVLVNIGPSITITSLTNTVAFGIGYLTPTPQMSLFCFCTSVAVFFDYILTFTVLAAVICLVTDGAAHNKQPKVASEKGDEQLVFPVDDVDCRDIPAALRRYAAFCSNKYGRVLALLSMVALYALSYTGVATMKSNFEPSKAFPSDSPLANSMDSIREVFNEFFPLNIIVSNPPNISDPQEYDRFYDMVHELEAMPESYGKDRTMLWLRPFEEMDRRSTELLGSVGFGNGKYTPSLENLEFFLQNIGNPPSVKHERVNGTTKLTGFTFTIIAKNMAEWSNRAVTEENCRQVLQKYPMFNSTIFDGDAAVLDLLLKVKMDLIGSIMVTIVCMTVICSFFIYNYIGVVIIAYVISSICFTLVGLLSWWGADLDPVTMVDVLLATGFSVDYTAHIAHQFYIKHGSTQERIAASLDEMCLPMLQAGTSTVLCMLPLIFVPTYAIVAFAKTVFLVVGIGLFHGLFILPVLLVVMPQRLPFLTGTNVPLVNNQSRPENSDSGVSEPFI